MKKFLLAITITTLLTGCGMTQVQESMFGLAKKDYIEPSEGPTAELTVTAPYLKTQMMLEDKIRVSLYNSCTDDRVFRSEGYIGGFKLSSKESVGRSKTVLIDAEKPLFVEVGYDQQKFQCTNKFRILPEESGKYKITWTYKRLSCRANGVKVINSNPVKSDEISQQNNTSGFWDSGSGRTTSEWRDCKE